MITIRDTSRLRIFLGNFQYFWPINGGYLLPADSAWQTQARTIHTSAYVRGCAAADRALRRLVEP
jgi:hypothetical protein